MFWKNILICLEVQLKFNILVIWMRKFQFIVWCPFVAYHFVYLKILKNIQSKKWYIFILQSWKITWEQQITQVDIHHKSCWWILIVPWSIKIYNKIFIKSMANGDIGDFFSFLIIIFLKDFSEGLIYNISLNVWLVPYLTYE